MIQARSQMRARNEAVPKHYDVWPENWYAVELFLLMQTQWRLSAGMGGLVWHGLDYAGLPAVLPALDEIELPEAPRPARRELLAQLRALEGAAAQALNHTLH